MANIFKHVMVKKPKRSTFNLSHGNSLTCNFGKLVPFLCEEVVPGDTWKVDSNMLVRFAPMKFPVMHEMHVSTHYFYVPFRLVWDEFEDFITGGADGLFGYHPGSNAIPEQPVYPRFLMSKNDSLAGVGSLMDYLNYPTTDSLVSDGWYVSALPLRAYQLIYNEFYRDENLIEDLNLDKSSGQITSSSELLKLKTLRNRAWSKDYFTSALPWTQRGPQQMVPVEGEGTMSGGSITSLHGAYPSQVYDTDGVLIGNVTMGNATSSPGVNLLNTTNAGASSGTLLSIDDSRNLTLNGGKINLDGLGFTINDLRRSNAIQRWLERNARGGSRYIESLLAHFGVVSDDLRLQRPEFLGGATTPVQVSDILQTSETTSTSPQGQYAGMGFSYGSVNGFKRSFKERGLIIGIMSVMPRPAYAEGCPRAYRKFDKFDYYWPEFAQLGEQEIFNYELSCRHDIGEVFGYAPRYAEYKYIPSRVHGEFKTTLNQWNLARHFSSQPKLSGEFVTCDAAANDLNRIFAVTDANEDHLFVQIRNNIKARRPMPYLPDPSL